MFSNQNPRYASYEIINSLPDEAIDFVWYVIDNYMQGRFPMTNLIKFNLINSSNRLSYDYLQDGEVVATFDTPYPYERQMPRSLVVYDNGDDQIIALPSEINL